MCKWHWTVHFINFIFYVHFFLFYCVLKEKETNQRKRKTQKITAPLRAAESNGNNNVYGLDTWGGEENRLTADEIHLSAKAESGEAYGLKVSGGADENKFTIFSRPEERTIGFFINEVILKGDGDSYYD